MEISKIKEHIIDANFYTMRYTILIACVFAVYLLSADYFFLDIWHSQYIQLYRVFDIIFTLIIIPAVLFYWVVKPVNLKVKMIGSFIFPLLFLLWSAAITGIDFQSYGLSTYTIVLLVISFFLYQNLLITIIYFLSSIVTLYTTIYISKGSLNDFTSLLFLLFPIGLISILMTSRNYRHKLNELSNQAQIMEMNKRLVYANENLEKEVETRTKEIRNALEKAQESDRLKSAFLANMSHEIRTPMNGILGFANLLQEKKVSAEKQKIFIGIIEKSGQRMLNIINNIIDISKIETGQFDIAISTTNVSEHLNFVYAFFIPEAEKKGLTLTLTNLLRANDSIIETDKEKLCAILINLIKNSIKFTPTGSIEIGCEQEQGTFQFYVKDTGIGISPEHLPVIFNRFSRVNYSLNSGTEGSGLGLAISKAYVEMLGGNIWVNSETGKGSEFYFTLPVKYQSVETNSGKNEVFADKQQQECI
jgi:signal transduction histidine kinase